jgi:hypothetical protein
MGLKNPLASWWDSWICNVPRLFRFVRFNLAGTFGDFRALQNSKQRLWDGKVSHGGDKVQQKYWDM